MASSMEPLTEPSSIAQPLKGLSLVSTILKKGTEKDNVHVEESLQRVQKKCSQLKLEITEFLQQNYEKFSSHSNSVVSLEKKLDEISSDHERLNTLYEKNLQDRLTRSAGKKEEIEQRLSQTQFKITFVHSLMEIHHKIETCSQELGRGNLARSAELIYKVQELVNVVGGIGCDAKVFRALKEKVYLCESNLKCELVDQWSTHIIWKPSVLQNTQEIEKSSLLNIHLSLPANSMSFGGVVKAMTRLLSDKEWQERVFRFGVKILERILKPLLVYEDFRLQFSELEDEGIKVSFIENKEDKGTVALINVLSDLLQLFNIINEMMCNVEDVKWMEYIGEKIESDLYDLLKTRLSHFSPKTSSEREAYTNLSTSITNFEQELKSLQLLPPSYSSLSSYSSQVDIHIIEQECQERLGKARSLLLLPIHETIPVGKQDTVRELEKLQLLPSGSQTTSKMNNSLPESICNFSESIKDLELLTFVFPSCLISKSIKDFVALIYETLHECTLASPPVATVTQLIVTARNMIDLFIAISRNNSRTTAGNSVPRSALVTHNNYMYVCHHILTIGHQFSKKISSEIETLTFIDFVPRLRQLAEECFLVEMERQTKNILSCLESVPSFDDIGTKPDKQDELSRGVKQSFLLIFKLSKLYHEVLPAGLRQRCNSGLLEVLVNEIVSRTLAVQDFSIEDGSFLHNFINGDIIDKCPISLSLTEDEFKTISNICPSWEKLKELSFVLNATQEDIVHQWEAGSLSNCMNVSEVKHLIRATFKNTQRRADNLAKIK